MCLHKYKPSICQARKFILTGFR